MRKKDKRQFIRLKVYHLAKYRPLSNPGEEPGFTLARIKDIGANGACLVTNESLPVATLIDLKINFPNLASFVSTLAKILWVKRLKKTERYEIGVQFVEIEESARNAIDKQIKLVHERFKNKNTVLNIIRKEVKMDRIAKIAVGIAIVCLITALSIKFVTMGKVLPSPMPINWARLADTFLLVSIALSLLSKK